MTLSPGVRTLTVRVWRPRMSRRNGPEPFFREDRGTWYVQIHGKQHNLGRDEEGAKQRWHELMAAPPQPKAVSPGIVAGIVDDFLDWVTANRAVRTFEW